MLKMMNLVEKQTCNGQKEGNEIVDVATTTCQGTASREGQEPGKHYKDNSSKEQQSRSLVEESLSVHDILYKCFSY